MIGKAVENKISSPAFFLYGVESSVRQKLWMIFMKKPDIIHSIPSSFFKKMADLSALQPGKMEVFRNFTERLFDNM